MSIYISAIIKETNRTKSPKGHSIDVLPNSQSQLRYEAEQSQDQDRFTRKSGIKVLRKNEKYAQVIL